MTSIHPNFNQIAEHQYVGGPDRLIVSRKDKDKDKDKNKDKDIFQKCRYIDNRYLISIYRTGLYVGGLMDTRRLDIINAHANHTWLLCRSLVVN